MEFITFLGKRPWIWKYTCSHGEQPVRSELFKSVLLLRLIDCRSLNPVSAMTTPCLPPIQPIDQSGTYKSS